jgi:hypothetical protein
MHDHDQSKHFATRRSTELTDHERTLLCSAIHVTLLEGVAVGSSQRLTGIQSETTNELRSLGTRLSCSPEWRAVFAA